MVHLPGVVDHLITVYLLMSSIVQSFIFLENYHGNEQGKRGARAAEWNPRILVEAAITILKMDGGAR
jgi:hypothetical protein